MINDSLKETNSDGRADSSLSLIERLSATSPLSHVFKDSIETFLSFSFLMVCLYEFVLRRELL